MPPQPPIGPDNKANATAAKPAAVKSAAAPADPRRGPPEESMWVHYSPHHEFPLSSTMSVGLHILVIVLLALVGWVAYKLGFGDETRPPAVTAVVVDSGGGGNKSGVQGGAADGFSSAKEDVNQPADTAPPTEAPPTDLKVPDSAAPPVFTDKNGTRPVTAPSVDDLIAQARQKAAAKGRGGPGTGGGKGTGTGEGVGTGTGTGKGKSQREKRVLRWSMSFTTQNGDDYLRQMRDIKPGGGAILAVPTTTAGQYEVIRDLSKRPAVGKVEDVAAINSIFWIDDKPESVANLARALGIKTPPYFVAFFPQQLEDELARLEHQKAGNATEDDIEETKFNVVSTGDGYKANCISVRLKGR